MKKEAFLIYHSFYDVIKNISDQDAGKLLKAVFEYEIKNAEIELPPELKMAFRFIKSQLDRDHEKYIERCEKNRDNVRKRWNTNDTNVCDRKQSNTNDTDMICNDMINKKSKPKEKSSFVIPLISDIQTYCQERKNSVDPQAFFDFYTAKGWMIGKNKMKDWRAAVRTWERKDNSTPDVFEAELNRRAAS